MPPKKPMLYLLCGKIASGKSTLAARLAERRGTVLISQDDWLPALYPEEIRTLEDYVRCFRRFAEPMGDHVVTLLQAGVSVVLDFPANTRRTRGWMRRIVDRAGSAHELHYLDVPDGVCVERLRARNAQGEHVYQATEDEFAQFTAHFEPPQPDEGFNVIRYG